MSQACAGQTIEQLVQALPAPSPGNHGFFVGASGGGKSTTAKLALERELRRRKERRVKGAPLPWPIIAFDPEDEYSVHGIDREDILLGPLTHRVNWDEYLELKDDFLDDPHLALAVVPDPRPQDRAQQLAQLAADCETTGGLLIVCDEIGNYARHAAETLDDMAARCRKWGIARGSVLWGVETRMPRIPITVRANMKWGVLFWLSEPADADSIEARCGAEVAERVKALPPGRGVLWAPNNPRKP